jgi:DNA-directed RNA polymerase subunit H (RpoH/RPB5)
MRDELLDLLGVAMIDREHLLEVAVDDRAARQLQALLGIVVGVFRDVAVGKHGLAG